MEGRGGGSILNHEFEYMEGHGRRLIKRICNACGKEFGAAPGNVAKGMGRYCSLTCARRGRGDQSPVTSRCKKCDKTFQTMASRIRRNRGRYCSQECYRSSIKEAVQPRRCDYCGKVEMVLPYKLRRKRFFCSSACFHCFQRKGRWLKCANETCINEVYQQRALLPNRKNPKLYCSRECFKLAYHGKRHHFWEGGADPHDKRREHEFTRHQRRLILERDQFCCRDCGNSEADVLHADHILAICLGGTRDISNGQTLCGKCHNTKTACDRIKNRERKLRIAA